MSLPVIDFGEAADPGAAIDQALSFHGFLQLANLGIDQSLVARAFAESDTFFTGTEAAKVRFAYRSAAENFGYQGLEQENLDPGAPPDLKQTFTMRNILAAPIAAERWPSPEFRAVMQALYAHLLDRAHMLQRVIAKTLGTADDFFVALHSGENVSLRLLFYPVVSDQQRTEQLGAGAHSDYGFLTFLFQQDVAGLQVRDALGQWIEVPPLEHGAVINSGDLLERWTNGRYRSTQHRVMANRGPRNRLSIAMFIDPDSAAMVEPLPFCVSADNPPRFAPVTTAEHIQAKLDASHKGRFEA